MKKKLYFNSFLCLLIYTLCAPFAFAADLTSSSFIVRDPVIGTGGGYGTSGSFRLFESLEPTIIGVGSGATFIGHYGFLYFAAPDAEDDSVGGGGGGGGGSGLIIQCRIADFNCDTHVNIFDLSILLYYVDHTTPDITTYDLSKDSKVDFIDTSIVFYYWDVEV